jgi:hypothetical protein
MKVPEEVHNGLMSQASFAPLTRPLSEHATYKTYINYIHDVVVTHAYPALAHVR